ncbi:MAG: TraB/GumN family protein [Pseudomonadota bacterium]
MSRLVLPLAAVLIALVALPGTGRGQDWLTRDLCSLTEMPVDPAGLVPNWPQIAQAAGKIENGTGRLWRITAPEGQVSHLWGTAHSTDPLILDLPFEVRTLIAAARMVALERDPIFQTRADWSAFNSGSQLFYGDGSRAFLDLLEPKLWAVVRERLSAFGYAESTIAAFAPAGVISVLLHDPCDDFAAGVLPIQDSRIQLLGLEAGARIIGLEEPFATLEAFNRPDMQATAVSIANVYGAYLAFARSHDLRRVIFSLYLTGQIGAHIALDRSLLSAYFNDPTGLYFQQTQRFLVDERNRMWMETLPPVLDAGRAFVAVGAFHLPGAAGLVTLLRDAGYTVTRVPLPGEVDGE